jgi:hypothetical protein
VILCKILATFIAHIAKAGPSYVGRTIDVPNRPATGPYIRVRGRNGRSKYARYASKRSGRPARLTARTPDLDRPAANSAQIHSIFLAHRRVEKHRLLHQTPECSSHILSDCSVKVELQRAVVVSHGSIATGYCVVLCCHSTANSG